MNKLFIIGNGLDLANGLPTSLLYNYRLILERYDTDCLFCNYCGDEYWNQFESNIGVIDWDEILENNLSSFYPDYSSDRESDRDSIIVESDLITDRAEQAIKSSLIEMIENANNELQNIKDNKDNIKQLPYNYDSNDIFINFNYTDTLQELYNVMDQNIYYVHGRLTKNNLIFGFNEKICSIENDLYEYEKLNTFEYEPGEFEGLDPYVSMSLNQLKNSFLNQLNKKYDFDAFREYLKLLEISEVIVIGHSMSNVDREYFEIIEEICNPRKWFISYYKKEEENNYKKLNYSFSQKVTTFEF